MVYGHVKKLIKLQQKQKGNDRKVAVAARQSLLNYMLFRSQKSTNIARPGSKPIKPRLLMLPCPDNLSDGNLDGTQDPTCGYDRGSKNNIVNGILGAGSRFGRLPQRFGIAQNGTEISDGLGEDFRDSSGARLWYAVSKNIVPSNNPQPLNFHRLSSIADKWLKVTRPVITASATILITVNSRAIAVVLAPGKSTAEQNERLSEYLIDENPAAENLTDKVYADLYFESIGGQSNADRDGIFVQAIESDNFNDSIASIELNSLFLPNGNFINAYNKFAGIGVHNAPIVDSPLADIRQAVIDWENFFGFYPSPAANNTTNINKLFRQCKSISKTRVAHVNATANGNLLLPAAITVHAADIINSVFTLEATSGFLTAHPLTVTLTEGRQIALPRYTRITISIGEPLIISANILQTLSVTLQTLTITLQPLPVTLQTLTITLPPSTVTLQTLTLTITLPPSTVTLQTLTITLPPSTVTLQTLTLTITLPPSTVTLQTLTLTITLPPSTVTLQTLTITLPPSTVTLQTLTIVHYVAPIGATVSISTNTKITIPADSPLETIATLSGWFPEHYATTLIARDGSVISFASPITAGFLGNVIITSTAGTITVHSQDRLLLDEIKIEKDFSVSIFPSKDFTLIKANGTVIIIKHSDKPKPTPRSFIKQNFVALLLSDIIRHDQTVYAPKVIYPWNKETSSSAPNTRDNLHPYPPCFDSRNLKKKTATFVENHTIYYAVAPGCHYGSDPKKCGQNGLTLSISANTRVATAETFTLTLSHTVTIYSNRTTTEITIQNGRSSHNLTLSRSVIIPVDSGTLSARIHLPQGYTFTASVTMVIPAGTLIDGGGQTMIKNIHALLIYSPAPLENVKCTKNMPTSIDEVILSVATQGQEDSDLTNLCQWLDHDENANGDLLYIANSPKRWLPQSNDFIMFFGGEMVWEYL